MKIVHYVSFQATPAIRRELLGLGISIQQESGFVAFQVDESYPTWHGIKAWIERHGASDVVVTTFAREEILAASWLELQPEWHHGYPQPGEMTFGYLKATYDLSRYCHHCGIGKVQNAPFQMKGEPKWGRRGILQLHWVFDEYFVRPDVWTEVFEQHRISFRPVLSTKGTELKTVVQLVIQAEASVALEGLQDVRCGACGRVKYSPVQRGEFPALDSTPGAAMAKTVEYFGSGASASRRVLVSKELAADLIRTDLRGVTMRPVASATGTR